MVILQLEEFTNKLGTKSGIFVFLILSVIFALPLLFTKNSVFIAISLLSSKLFLTGAFWYVYYIAPESFPPLFVPFSFSAATLVGRIVTIAAPQVAEIEPEQTPMIVFLIVSGLSAITVLFLRKNKAEDPTITEQSQNNEKFD